MKSIFKITIVLALMVIAGSSFAGVDPYIKAKGEKLFSVHHNTTGAFRVTIKDQNGVIVYSINSNKNKKFVKTFDVKNLPNGRYHIVTQGVDNVNTYALQITPEGLNISKDQVLFSAR